MKKENMNGSIIWKDYISNNKLQLSEKAFD